jgi:hypothetical protein
MRSCREIQQVPARTLRVASNLTLRRTFQRRGGLDRRNVYLAPPVGAVLILIQPLGGPVQLHRSGVRVEQLSALH